MGGLGGGRYIICDECKETTFSLNLPWQYDGKTVQAAKEASWYVAPGTLRGPHICPACREKNDERTAV